MLGPVLLESKNKMVAMGPRDFKENDWNQALYGNLGQNSTTQSLVGITTISTTSISSIPLEECIDLVNIYLSG